MRQLNRKIPERAGYTSLTEPHAFWVQGRQTGANAAARPTGAGPRTASRKQARTKVAWTTKSALPPGPLCGAVSFAPVRARTAGAPARQWSPEPGKPFYGKGTRNPDGIRSSATDSARCRNSGAGRAFRAARKPPENAAPAQSYRVRPSSRQRASCRTFRNRFPPRAPRSTLRAPSRPVLARRNALRSVEFAWPMPTRDHPRAKPWQKGHNLKMSVVGTN